MDFIVIIIIVLVALCVKALKEQQKNSITKKARKIEPKIEAPYQAYKVRNEVLKSTTVWLPTYYKGECILTLPSLSEATDLRMIRSSTYEQIVDWKEKSFQIPSLNKLGLNEENNLDTVLLITMSYFGVYDSLQKKIPKLHMSFMYKNEKKKALNFAEASPNGNVANNYSGLRFVNYAREQVSSGGQDKVICSFWGMIGRRSQKLAQADEADTLTGLIVSVIEKTKEQHFFVYLNIKDGIASLMSELGTRAIEIE